MNKLLKNLNLTFLCMLLPASLMAAGGEDKAFAQYVHQGQKYPPILFQTNIEEQAFADLFNSYGAFEQVDDDAIGAPIGVRVLKGLRIKQDATGFTSVMLSASTLGIIPVVTNKDFKVRYDVFIQGRSIANFEYQMTSTDVENMWSGPRQNTMKPAEEIFLEQSIGQFLTELKKNEEVQQLFDEYFTYYGHQ